VTDSSADAAPPRLAAIGGRIGRFFRGTGSGKSQRPLHMRFLGWWKHGRLIGLVFLIAAGVVRSIDPGPVEALRLRTFDLYQNLKPRADTARPVTIVDIDDESLQAIGQWPWPRHLLAQMVTNLTQKGAVVIGFDAVFPEFDRLSPNALADNVVGLTPELAEEIRQLPSNDEIFAEALRNGRVVLGQSAFTRVVAEAAERLPEKSPRAFRGPKPQQFLPRFVSVVRNNSIIEPAAMGHGMFTVEPDSDGIVRRVPAIIRVANPDPEKDDIVYPALAVEMLRIAGSPDGKGAYSITSGPTGITNVKVRLGRIFTIKTMLDGRIWVNFTPHDREGRYVSAKDVIDGTVPTERIQGKLILVGTSAIGLLDIRATPIDGALPGVEIHANILETILGQSQLNRPPDVQGQELTFAILVGILMIVLLPIIGAAWSLGLGVVLVGGLVGVSWFSYAGLSIGEISWWFIDFGGRELFGGRTLVDVTYPAVSTFALYSLLTYTSYSETAAEKKQVRGQFSQYLSPALVEQLADDPERMVLGGEMKTMSLLFCDIRGFTTISETFKTDPQGLTQLINAFLTPMTDVILARNGTIDKYMGDCIMAFWNAPLDDADHARHACDSALAMFEDLPPLNERLRIEAEEDGRPHHPIKVGIGINSGDCVVGNMGSTQRFDYSVLGDAVNLAARLEGQSKNYGVKIVLGHETVLAATEFATIELDFIAVKGKTEGVHIFALLGRADVKASSEFQALLAVHEEMISTYRGQDFAKAEGLLAECREAAKPLMDDGLEVLYDLYDERLEEFKVNPPPADWDGVFVATSK
jgi:adenylate cyclase